MDVLAMRERTKMPGAFNKEEFLRFIELQVQPQANIKVGVYVTHSA